MHFISQSEFGQIKVPPIKHKLLLFMPFLKSLIVNIKNLHLEICFFFCVWLWELHLGDKLFGIVIAAEFKAVAFWHVSNYICWRIIELNLRSWLKLFLSFTSPSASSRKLLNHQNILCLFFNFHLPYGLFLNHNAQPLLISLW